MKKIASPLVVAGAAVGLLLAGTTAADAHSSGGRPAATARAETTSRQLTFTTKPQDSASYTKSDGIYFDKDYSGKLGLVGYNMVSFSSKGIWVVVTVDGGFLYLTVTGVVGSKSAHGVVTGGAGSFAGVRGSFAVTSNGKGGGSYVINLTK